MAKIKRSQIQTFLNTTPLTTATYSLIGNGVKTGKIDYKPKVNDETFINADSATITVESYAPAMPIEQLAISGDPIFEYVDALRINRSVLTDAETDVVNVWMYETGGPTAYPAEKQNVTIQVENFGGDGGTTASVGYTISYRGGPVVGTFNASTKAFTPS